MRSIAREAVYVARHDADLSFASHLHPPLTTLRQGPYGIGRAAAELLPKRIHGKLTSAKPRRVRLEPELVIRGSTAPPR